VLGLHDLRTRKMADNALVDAHILVDPKISVSEGHYIAELARHAVLSSHHVLDVMVHIDPEDDMQACHNAKLPSRPVLLAQLAEQLGQSVVQDNRVIFHYLDGQVDVELYLTAGELSAEQIKLLQSSCDVLVGDSALFRAIHVHSNHGLLR
jgi:Dimerisation domain of Zinc Transporter